VQTPTRSSSLSSTEPSGPIIVVLVWCLVLLSLCAARPFIAAARGKGDDIEVVRITPAGAEVPPGGQVVIEFDRPVVPLGRMEREAAEIPVTIEPQLGCQWRWLSPSTLACHLAEQERLQPATRYTVTVNPGPLAEDGAGLSQAVRMRFTTELPRVTEAWFGKWLSPPQPVTRIRFNLPMDPASLAAHLFYSVAGGRRIAAVVEEDAYSHGLWQVRPQTDLPTGMAVELRVEPGLLSTKGRLAGTENRVIDTLFAIPEFRFLGIECTDAGNETVVVGPATPPAARKRCLPSGGISLLFSSPVLAEDVAPGLQLTPPLVRRQPDADPWDEVNSYQRLDEAYSEGRRYPLFLPESILRPFTDYRLQFAADSIKDQFGRRLADPVEMVFATAHRAPDFALVKNMPVLEKGLDIDAHVWSVNLEAIDLTYEAAAANGRTAGARRVIRPDGPQDASIPVPLGVRETFGADSGLVQGHFTTRPQVPDKAAEEAWFFAQVTPFQVHLKLGHHNSLVWITDLRTGEPVAGVRVEALARTFRELNRPGRILAAAETAADGVAELPGTATLDPTLELIWADGEDKPGLFLRCVKDGDLAMLPVRYEYQAASEGANREYIPEWLRPLHGHIHTWGATAQGIYRAGDTVQFKIYVRDQNNLRFTRPPGVAGDAGDPATGAGVAAKGAAAVPSREAEGGKAKSGPPRYHLAVEDPLGRIVHERKNIVLSPFGSFDGEIRLPRNGAVGWYRFRLTSSFSKEEWQPLRVLVSDFTPSPFKVTADLNGQSFTTGDTVEVTSEARLHAGGPYTEAATKVTATLEPRPFIPDRPEISGYQFDSTEYREVGEVGPQTLYETEGHLDDRGTMVSSFAVVETPVWFGRLTVESTVSDDRGKSIAGRTSAPCYGRDRFVGVLQGDWTLEENKSAGLRVVVVDREGRIVPDVPVSVTTEYKKTWAARVKGAGSDYLTEYQHRWEPEQQLQATSGSGPVEMRFTPGHAGRLRLTATIVDGRGRRHATVIERWVTGAGTMVWESTPGNLLDVFPEKNNYRIGDTARFLVQNPFPGAQALITVERFGVIHRWQQVLAGSSEIIEIPVKPDYLPGFYLSVLVTSPRVDRPPGAQGEDLGKPTWRMGYVKVPVQDPYKELAVEVRPEKEVYRPGDEVRVDLQVSPRHAGTEGAAPPVELAVAVLDEAVFDLLLEGEKAFDPYRGFYSLDDLDLSNYNLVMQLVGREKLALKGASPGGGGGPDLSMRSLFKFVSYWNPSLRPDAAGKATIRFRVPDNLTGWRVLAMAVTPEDRMGLGQGGFKVNQSTEIRPALPNQVVTGDRFDAVFTLMNRTDTARRLQVVIRAEGPAQPAAAGAGSGPAMLAKTVTAAPFKRVDLRLPLVATGAGKIEFTVSAGDAADTDGLRQTLRVLDKELVVNSAVYGMTSGTEAIVPVAVPKDIREDRGSISLQLSPTVVGGVDGAFAFVRDYPYSCWEQKLTRGVMAAMYPPLKPFLKTDFSWPESAGAVAETLAAAIEHQAPNGGMTFYIPEDRHVSPYLSAFTLQAFNWMRQQGHPPPAPVEARLQDYLLNLLRHDATPDDYSRGMTMTVRALALAALAERGRVTAGDVRRYQAQLPAMSLFGRSFYLRAMLLTGMPLPQQHEVLAGILSHAGETGGGQVFGETLDSGYQALLASPVRDNAAILINLLAWLVANPADAGIGEMPARMMRSLTLSRQGRDHWAGTQENLFVVKALTEYTRLFEQQRPDMRIQGTLDARPFGMGRFTAFTDPPLVLQRPLTAGDAGRKTRLGLEKEGDGRLYYAARLAYTPLHPPITAVNAGIEVHREYSVVRAGRRQLLQPPLAMESGEVVQVDLFVQLSADRCFVVVDDPVPGGLEPVNRDLATTAQADDPGGEEAKFAAGSHGERFTPWRQYGWGFYHRELRHDAVRFYSERLPAGRYHLRYAAQAITPGDFRIGPVHAEEMYAPDVFGDSEPGRLRVEAATAGPGR